MTGCSAEQVVGKLFAELQGAEDSGFDARVAKQALTACYALFPLGAVEAGECVLVRRGRRAPRSNAPWLDVQ